MRRGVLESQAKSGDCWAMQFADKTCNIRTADLKVLSSDAASFEPSQAPLSAQEKRASAAESSKGGLSIAASTSRVR